MVGPNTVENYYSVFKRGMKGVYQQQKLIAISLEGSVG
jgi:hypothetical protein